MSDIEYQQLTQEDREQITAAIVRQAEADHFRMTIGAQAARAQAKAVQGKDTEHAKVLEAKAKALDGDAATALATRDAAVKGMTSQRVT